MNQGNKQKQTMRGILSLAMMLIIGLLLFSRDAQAATGINKQINFQGKVTNTDGTNVTNGSYTFLFCIYTVSSPSTACTSGADNDAVWRESKSITVTDGVFQTNLGDTTAFASLIDFNTDNIYLGINFNANGQMTPLVRFTASPYAMNAGKVAGLTVTDTTGTLTIPAGKTISFADAFTTSGAFATTLTSTAITNATLPAGTITLADLATGQTLTNKIIGSTGLTFTGAATDITTGTDEDLTVTANGTGIISLNDAVTVANALAANGGITFDASTDTVGAHTLSGTIDASTQIITNIGNAGTDFVASTGALTLAGVLTANGGITLAGSQTFTGNALSFVDLGSITQGSTANQGLRLPQAASATPSNPTSGEGYIAWDAAGNQLITYNGSAWTTVGGGSQTPWTSDISAAGYDLGSLSNLGFQETTGAPTGTDVGFYRDNSGDLTGNVLTGKTFNLAVNGGDEYNFSSTGLEFNSNNITGLGTNLTAAGTLTIASTTTGLTLDSGSNTLTVAASDTTLTASGITTVTLGTNTTITSAGTITLDSGSNTIVPDADTFQTNDVTSTGALSFVAGSTAQNITLSPSTTGTVIVASSTATSDTIKFLPTPGAATFAGIFTTADITASDKTYTFPNTTITVNAAADISGTTLASNVITSSLTTVGTLGSLTVSGATAANGGITFDASTDTVGAFTGAGTIDMNGNIIVNIGSTATDFTTSGSLAIGLDAADTNGALMVDNVSQANPIIVAKDNGTMVWQVGDGGLITVDPATTGTVQGFALATQWTTGTVVSAAFGGATTQSAGTMTGIALDFNTNLTTPAAGQNVTGLDVKLPVASTTSNATVYTGLNLSTAGAVTNATAGSFAWRGTNIQMPNITQSAGGSVTASGVLVTSGSITTAGTENMLSLSASGVTVGTLNGLNIGTITGSTGTETAINVGSGWDTILGGTTAGTNLIGFSNFTVTSAGVMSGLTGLTMTSGTIAANGGITFDNNTDTVGAFTAAGTIDMSTQIITNIGNTGTDFVASTGALTLAGVLTANGGISLAGGQSLTAGALSYVDLGSIVHNTTAVQGIRLPQAASATPSNPTGGLEGYIAWDTAGNQLITYNGSAWSAVGGSSGYNLIKNETTGLTARTTLAFLGAGVDCADSGSQTECTISGGAGSDLAGTYNTGSAGNQTITLDGTQDSIIISNPASSGTDSAFALKVDQLAGGAVDGLQIANAGTGNGLKINATGTGNLALFQNNGVDKVTFANNGSMTINGADSSIVRDTTAQFTSGTVGSKLVNTNDRIEMSDGTPASNVGTITTSSQPAVNVNIGAGSMSISRPNGKYLVVHGGAVLTTSIYDPVAGTFTAGNAIIPGNGTGFSAGAIALPRANGMYVVIIGTGTTAATANVDPSGAIPNTAGPALATNAITVAGTVAYKRPDGKYLVTVGGGVTTQIYDPVANTFTLGPPATAMGNFGAGALAIPRPDGTALIVSGGSASTTAIYSPFAGSATIGSFILAPGLGFGPKLDGTQAAGTCGINGAGSVAIKRQDGKFLILSKGGASAAAVSALYDPVANTMTCRTSNGPSAALGDGAHAIPLQNGKFLIFRGANTTDAWIYSQDTDAFAAWGGTTPVAITAGAHSILRTDGTWQTITGTNTCTNGCTFNYDTSLPMSDPFPSQVTAGAPSAGGSCTAGTHSYYVTFVMSGSVESELSNKSNIVSCTAGSGTVALTTIPVGPLGTTARKIYRTPTGDVGVPQLLTTISDNTTLTYNDTTADGSLGSAYSVTAATTWYTTEDISSTALSPSSTLRWNAQLEAVYAANRNTATNTAFKVMQFFVKTAVNNSGCATPLANAPWQEIQNSGDLINAALGVNCIKISVHFNRAMPKRLFDDRGVWMGNGNTVLRYDYVTPTLFSLSVDNSAVLKRYAFDFSSPNSNDPARTTLPVAPTSAAPAGSGSCTSGNHYWFVTFVINGVESLLSPASTVQNCSGSNIETLNPIPTGPSGTTARKIYRTKAADVATDTPFYVGTVSDNSTTTFADSLADSSLGAAFASTTPSGPTLSRGESSRVEMVNNQLTLPWGRITPTTQGAANALGFYMGAFGADHPLLNNLAGIGTFVIARDDKTFLVVEAGNSAGTADLYDPVTQTFTNQTGAGNVPTGATASGAFAIKRPNGKFLVVLGTGITTTACTVSGTATNVYDQYAPPGSRFTNGPCLSATAGQGAFAIQNADGTFTILHGNATTGTTIYDPVRNTMISGPLQTTGTNVGGLAIPLMGPMNNMYKVILGTTLGGAVATGTMVYNANTKIFSAGTALGVGSGSGAYAFQRADGFWILVKGTATGTTSLINPYNGLEAAGPAFTTSTSDRGGHVIPRADGTFLMIGGNAVSGVGVTSNIYLPSGGAFNATAGAVQGVTAVGPTTVLPGTGSVPAAPTSGAPTAGGACTAGAHFWKYSYVTQGIESPLSAVSATQTCVLTTGQTVPLTVVSVGPTGTTARRIYRTLAGAAATAPYYLVGTINDNTTTTFSDTFADPAATNPYNGGGVGDGALSFQRPDGKWITIFAGSTPSKTTNIYDAGWYPDGQYMSEQMNVTPMAANSTLDWQQTPDQYVRMEVRSAASQTALSVAGSNIVSNPGGSIGNALNDNWVQVTVNFRRDFPTFPGSMNGVYNSTGGMVYGYRQISMPTVNSFQITNGMDLMTLQNNGLNVLRVTSNGNIMSSTGGGFFSGGADLAENYTSTQALDKGEVVMIDRNNPEGVLRSAGQYETSVLGVVSTAPGFVAGGYTQDSYPIALVGRVPVKISTENGPVRIGDYLTASSIPGYAMRATQAGRALGRALESFDETKAVACPSQGLGNLPTTLCGSVMMFVNLTDYFGMPVDVVMAEQTDNMNGVDGLSSDPITTEKNGLETPSNIRLAISAPAKERQTLGYLMKLRDARSSGSTMPASELFTDRISASTSVTTPTLVADQIFARSIQAESIEGLSIWTDQLQSLSEKYAGLEATQMTSNTTETSVQSVSEQKAFAVALKNISTDAITVQLDGSILGKLSVGGALRIGGDVQIEGNTVFGKLATFLGETLFKEHVTFEQAPTFGSNTAGFAVIEEGAQSVDISFDEEYLKQPIITVSIANSESPLTEGADQDLQKDIQAVEDDFISSYFESDIKFVVTKKSVRGFTIVLSKQAPRELSFSWVAIAVNGAKTSYSDKEIKPVSALAGEPSVSIKPVTNSEPIIVPTGTPEAVVPQEEAGASSVTPDSGNNTQIESPVTATAP